MPLVRRVRVTALESSHWSQNVIWDFMINDFDYCGQSNNHDNFSNHHHFSISPSDWRQTRAKSPSCPAASSRTLSSDLSPRSPCGQSEDRASPLFLIKSKTFLPTSPLPVDQDSPFLDPCSGFWLSNGQIVTIVSELELRNIHLVKMEAVPAGSWQM